jgi:type II secretory pathway component PulJ
MKSRSNERGVSLVELMVGLAAGLAVALAAVQWVDLQSRWHRSATLESRLLHDLNASAELIHRSLRRAGQHGDALLATTSDGSRRIVANPHVEVVVADRGRGISVSASRDRHDDHLASTDEQASFRLDGGVLEARIGAGPWQAVTDAGVLRMTDVRFVLATRPAGCGSQRLVRTVEWTLRAEATADARLQREVRGLTRIRHDATGALATGELATGCGTTP